MPPAARGGDGEDRQVLLLGQLDREVPRTRGVDVGAGDHHGLLRLLERGRRAPRSLRGRARARRRPGASITRSVEGRIRLAVPVVHRDRDERGALRRRRGQVDRPRQRVRHIGGARGLEARLDERVRHACRVAVGQVRVDADMRAHLLSGRDQERRVVRLRVEDAAHRVAHAWRRVEVRVPDRARRLRVAIGQAHDDELLKAQDVAEVRGEVREHRQLCRARIAEHRRHPVPAKKLVGGLANARHEADTTSRHYWRIRRPTRASRRASLRRMRELIHLAPGMRVRAIAERVRRIAEAQEGVIGRAQLEACGLSGGEISRWVAQGRLIRILPGGLRAGSCPDSPGEGGFSQPFFMPGRKAHSAMRRRRICGRSWSAEATGST